MTAGTCECGCGRSLRRSPSLWFTDSSCQTLFLLSAGREDEAGWRAQQRLLHVLACQAPGWGDGYVAYTMDMTMEFISGWYGQTIWKTLQLGECPPVDWTPTLDQAIQVLTVRWHEEWSQNPEVAELWLDKVEHYKLAVVLEPLRTPQPVA